MIKSIMVKCINKNRIIDCLILALLVFTRLLLLDKFPQGLNCDEQSAAYEAYSILKTGYDRVGNFLPIYLVSWGSGQNAMLTYLMIPLIKIFGVNVWTTRLPIAIISVIADLIIVKLIIKSLSIDNKNNSQDGKYSNWLLITLLIFFIIINPWDIMKSRFGLESNLFPPMFIIGFYFLYMFIISNFVRMIYLILGSVFVGLSAYCYSTSYVFLPIFIILYYIYLARKNISIGKKCLFIILSTISILIIVWPLILYVLINFFDLPQINLSFMTIPRLYSNRMMEESITGNSNFLISAISSFIRLIKLVIIQNDGLLWNAIPKFGLYYMISIPFLFIGLVSEIYGRIRKYKNSVLDDMVFIAFLSGVLLSLFIKEININRINILIYFLLYYIIKGIKTVYYLLINLMPTVQSMHEGKCGKSLLPNIFLIILLLIYMINFILFFNSYINIKSKDMSTFTDSIENVVNYTDRYKNANIYFDYIIKEPYINVLYFLAKKGDYNPKEFTNTVMYRNKKPDFESVISFSNWHFIKMSKDYFESSGNIKPNDIYITNKGNADYLRSIGFSIDLIGTYCIAYK